MAGQGSKIVRLTRMGLVCVLCFESFACGARPGRDLSMQGAFGKFDERRAATRAKQAEMSLGSDAIDLKPLPQRRELLQVRVPSGMVLDDIVDGVVAASISGMVTETPVVEPVAANPSAPKAPANAADVKRIDSQLQGLQARIASRQRDLRAKQADYDVEKLALDQMDMRHAKARRLLLQSFKIANEKLLQTNLAQLAQQYDETQPQTVLGLTEGQSMGALALFGRNELARADEFVDLRKSFLFVGADIGTGISLGRMDDLAKEVGSRDLSVNLAGLRLATALKSLARSIDMPVYLSPGVEAAPQKVRLEISKADALDIFDILIDNYGLAMAYDRKMGIARFYTREEFNIRVDSALQLAEAHNKRAANYRTISSLENDEAAIRQIYRAYFQNPDDEGRALSLTNDALIEEDYSPLVSAAIIALKEAALANERELDKLDAENGAERQQQALKTQAAKFLLDDTVHALADLINEKSEKQAARAEAQREVELTALAPQPVDATGAPAPMAATAPSPAPMQRFLAGPDVDILRGRVIQDANLKTTEPIYTEKFTVYNSEGANTCGGEGGDRTSAIKEELENYFTQLYPDELLKAESDAESAEEQRKATRRQRQLASAEGLTGIADDAGDPLLAGNGADAENANEPEAVEQQPAETQAQPDSANSGNSGDSTASAASAASQSDNAFRNSNFRRPKITSVADTVIVTGFRHDVELANSLIENLDQPDKQVLVEVFMVNVVKNWQRQLQGRLQNALRIASKTDADVAALPGAITSAYPDIVEVRNQGLIGVRGAMNFANRAASTNNFTLNNFRLGLAWTIDFMEQNSLGRKVSSPTILALDGCAAEIVKSETRYLPVTTTSAPVVTPGGQTIPGEVTVNYEPRIAELKLQVTPTINPLNDHVRLKVLFNDDFFVSADANSDKIQSTINTEFISAPGDVIVLAGLYTEDNSKSRNSLPGMTEVPLLSTLLGTSSDQLNTQEMVIFLAPEVITPETGKRPVNSAQYYGATTGRN